ncbi:MAG: tetratricopeptide repeat protein, partial [Acidobacteriaceae bacterium]|nr:tetratricopeptide repeat protein [Acidobacteriaceae bacterium]
MKSFLWIALLTLRATAISQIPPASNQAAATEAFRAGRAAMEHNDLTRAHAEFAKVARLAPDVAAGHSALGAVLYAEGNPSAAIPELERARSLDPKDSTATLNLALSYSALRAYDKSLPLFRELDSASTAFAPSDLAAYARALDAAGD